MRRLERVELALLLALASACAQDPKGAPATVALEARTRAPVIRTERVNGSTVLHHREDGSVTAEISAAPTAVRGAGGQWRPIALRLLREPEGALVSDANLVLARFPARLGTGGSVELGLPGAAPAVRWSPAWPHGVSAQVRSAGDRAVYELGGVLRGVREEFRVLRGAIKHDVVFPSREALLAGTRPRPDGTRSVEGRLTLAPGVRLESAAGESASFVTREPIAVITPGGERLTLPAPFAFEQGSGARVPAAYRWEGGVLSVEVDRAWLEAPERRFPVVIDPPASVLSGYAVHVGSDAASPSATYRGSLDALRIGAENLGGNNYDYFQLALRFDLSGLEPAGALVAASAGVYLEAPGAGPLDLHFSRLDLDPERAMVANLWVDTSHETDDYGAVTATGGCLCRATAPFNAQGLSDLQQAIAGDRIFRLAAHPVSFTDGNFSAVQGVHAANPPVLTVDYGASTPRIRGLSPRSGANDVARTVEVVGSNLQEVLAVSLSPAAGGAATAATFTVLEAARLRVTVPASLTPGPYYVSLSTAQGAAPNVDAGLYLVTGTGTRTWSGPADGTWATASNWTPSGVPGAWENVIIPAGAGSILVDVPSVQVNSLQMAGNTLQLGPNALQVWSDLRVSGGAITMDPLGALEVQGNAFLHPTALGAASRLRFAAPSGVAGSTLGGRVALFDDLERGTTGWAQQPVPVTAPWAVQQQVHASGLSAWHQPGKQVASSTALSPPAFSTLGATQAILSWKARYVVSTVNGGSTTGDGWTVQYSVNGGTSWTTIAPTAASRGRVVARETAAKCSDNSNRTANPVTASAVGYFAGIQQEFVQDSIPLPADALGKGSVLVRFAAGYDSCVDFGPNDGVYLDDVAVTLDASTTLGSLEVAAQTALTTLGGVAVSGALDLATNTSLVVEEPLTVSGEVNSSGVLRRLGTATLELAGPFTNYGLFEAGTGPVRLGALYNAGRFLGGAGALTVTGQVQNLGELSTGTGDVTVGGALQNLGTGTLRTAGFILDVAGDLLNDGSFLAGDTFLRLSGASATWTGAGTYSQTSASVRHFYDGFESGTLLSGWTAVGPSPLGPPPPGDFYLDGGYAAQQVGAGSTVLTLDLPTVGLTGTLYVGLGFNWTSGCAACSVKIEYSVDGTSWVVHDTRSGFGGALTSSLPAEASDNPSFKLRFTLTASAGTTTYLDNVELTGPGGGLSQVEIAAAPGAVKTISLPNPLEIRSAFIGFSGGARLAPGTTLELDSADLPLLRLDLTSQLEVAENATVALGYGGELQVNFGAKLILAGTSDASRARVVSATEAAVGRFIFGVAGELDASWFEIGHLQPLGVELRSGASLLRLDDGYFHHPQRDGQLLTLVTTAPLPAANRLRFEDPVGTPGAANVDSLASNVAFTIAGATGGFAGEAFDRDFGGAEPGNILWTPGGVVGPEATRAVVVSAAEPAPGTANSVSVTIQLQDGAGTPATLLSDYSAMVTQTGSASVTGSPITISAGQSQATVTVTDVIAETVTLTLTETTATTVAEEQGTVVFIAGPPSKLAFGQQPLDTVAGTSITPAVTVRLLDAWDNLTDATDAVTVLLDNNPGPGTLGGTLSQPGVGGVATFADLWLDRAATGYRLRARSGTLAEAVSGTFTITPATASALVFVVEPSDVVAGSAVSPAVELELQDPFGNRTGSTAQVSLALDGNPVGGTLTGGAAVAAVAGRATFPDLRIDKASSGYTLRASSGALVAISQAIEVFAGPAVALQVEGPASPAEACASHSFTVRAVDAGGNVDPTYAGTVSLSGGGQFTPSAYTFVPGDAGQHTFEVLWVSAGSQSITATDTATASITGTRSGIEVVPGPAISLELTGLAATAVAGVAEAFSITAIDGCGNVASSYRGEVTLTAGGTVTASPPSWTFTEVDNGAHAFSLTFFTAGTQLVSATDPAGLNTETTVEVAPGPAHSVHLTVGEPSCDAPVELQLVDEFDNPVPAVHALELSVNGSATFVDSSLGPPPPGAQQSSGKSSGTGFATALIGDERGETVTLTAGGPGLVAVSRPITFAAGPADAVTSELNLSSGTIQSRQPGVFATVIPRDACGRFTTVGATALNLPAALTASLRSPSTGDSAFVYDLLLPACPASLDDLQLGASLDGQPLLDGAGVEPRQVPLTPTCVPLSFSLSTVEVAPPEAPVAACWTQDGAATRLWVTPRDENGNLMGEGMDVAVVESTPSVRASAATESNGVYEVRVGSDRCGTHPVVVTLNGAQLASLERTFTCPPVRAGNALVASPSSQQLALGATAAISGTVLDACGNPAFARTVEWSASGGVLGGAVATTDADGKLSATLTPDGAGQAEVRGTVEGVALTSAIASFTLPPTGVSAGLSVLSGADARPGSKVELAGALENVSGYRARDLVLHLRAEGLQLREAAIGGVALARLADGVDQWLLPELSPDAKLEVRVTGVLTAGSSATARAFLQVRSVTDLPASAEVSTELTAGELTVELGGCGCTGAGGSPLALLALALLVASRRRR